MENYQKIETQNIIFSYFEQLQQILHQKKEINEQMYKTYQISKINYIEENKLTSEADDKMLALNSKQFQHLNTDKKWILSEEAKIQPIKEINRQTFQTYFNKLLEYSNLQNKSNEIIKISHNKCQMENRYTELSYERKRKQNQLLKCQIFTKKQAIQSKSIIFEKIKTEMYEHSNLIKCINAENTLLKVEIQEFQAQYEELKCLFELQQLKFSERSLEIKRIDTEIQEERRKNELKLKEMEVLERESKIKSDNKILLGQILKMEQMNSVMTNLLTQQILLAESLTIA